MGRDKFADSIPLVSSTTDIPVERAAITPMLDQASGSPSQLARLDEVDANSAGRCPHSKQKTPPKRWRTWAELMKRAFEVDVLVCPHCGVGRKLISLITDPGIIRRILAHLRWSSRWWPRPVHLLSPRSRSDGRGDELRPG